MENGRSWVRPVIAVAFVASILAAVILVFYPHAQEVSAPPLQAKLNPTPPTASLKSAPPLFAPATPASMAAKAVPATHAVDRAQNVRGQQQSRAAAAAAVDPAIALQAAMEIADAAARRAAMMKIFAAWAASDTQTAFEFADTLADPADQDAALQAIESVAPVGIGVALRMENGFPLIFDLVPGSNADIGGQVGVGDVILAVGQGDGELVSLEGMQMEDIVGLVRGAPGTPVDLVVIPADAEPGDEPVIVEIPRAQIIFNRG